MKKLISAKAAGKILLFFMVLLVVFHVLVLLRIIPKEVVWGGNINDKPENLILMEIIALAVTLVFIFIIAAKTYRHLKFRRLANIGTWIIFVYLVINTLGNFTSKHFFENTILAFLTLIMSFFALRLAIEKHTIH